MFFTQTYNLRLAGIFGLRCFVHPLLTAFSHAYDQSPPPR